MSGPTCAPFSSLNMGWNYAKMKMSKARDMIEDGMRHLAYAAELSMHQAKRGKYFAIEHCDGDELANRDYGITEEIAGGRRGRVRFLCVWYDLIRRNGRCAR